MSKLTEKMKVKESQSASNLDSSDEEQGELDMSPLKVSWYAEFLFCPPHPIKDTP